MSLTPDHDVLIDSGGWIPISELTREHKIATLNYAREMEYQNPSSVHAYDTMAETVYSYDFGAVSLRGGPNHRVCLVGQRVLIYTRIADLILTEPDVVAPAGIRHTVGLRPSMFHAEEYTGPQFSISVANSNYFVRRNGKIHFTG